MLIADNQIQVFVAWIGDSKSFVDDLDIQDRLISHLFFINLFLGEQIIGFRVPKNRSALENTEESGLEVLKSSRII